MAEEALDALKEDLDKYLRNEDEVAEEKRKKEEKKKEEDDTNPFKEILRLFDFFKGDKKKDKDKIEKPEDIKKDSYVEKMTRANAAKEVADWLFTVYDVYKKTHGMASSPEDFRNADKGKVSVPNAELGDVFRGVGKQSKQ